MFSGFFNRFRGLDRIFCWSFLGFVAGVIGIILAVVGVYLTFYYERPTEISCEILSRTAVLDIKEDVGKLEVLYNGENIREQNKQLTIFVFRIENTGSTTILKNQYDDKHPLGVGVKNGAFAEPPYSTDYSDERLMNLPSPDNYLGVPVGRPYRDKITYPPNILEPGDYWTDRALVIHDKDVEPSIYAFGKIGGVRELAVTVAEPRSDGARRSFDWRGVEFVVIPVLLFLGMWLLAIIAGYFRERLFKYSAIQYLSLVDDDATRSVVEYGREHGTHKMHLLYSFAQGDFKDAAHQDRKEFHEVLKVSRTITSEQIEAYKRLNRFLTTGKVFSTNVDQGGE